MFEYMFSLVTDEFKVVGEGQETQHFEDLPQRQKKSRCL